MSDSQKSALAMITKRMRLWGPSEFDVNEKMEILRDKMKALVARESDVCNELENAELKLGKVRRMEVVHWLKSVKERTDKFQNTEEEFQQKPTNSSNSEMIARIQRATELAQQLLEQGKFSNGLVLNDLKARSLLIPVKNLVGELFKKNIENVREGLENPQTFLIGVYGMGGVGKTTLLKHINNDLVNNYHIYGRVCWVTVSEECSLYQLQQKIFNVLTGDKDIEERDEDRRAVMLHNVLANMQKLVLILDDVWKPLMLEKVGVFGGANNCKIIMSSRSEDVCRKMGCFELVKVRTLSKSEAWQLFVEYLVNYQELATEIRQIAALVAEECSGLPLAIITIAASLRGVFDIREWKDALDELRDPNRGHYEMENDVFPKLKFSYDRLNDEVLKSCFLSCVLFPEDALIRREELIDLWICEGLLDGIESTEARMNKGHTILNKLVYSCLLEQVGVREQSVKMHDLVREMGIYISRPHFMAKSRLLLKEVPEEELWTKDLIKVSLSLNEIETLPHNMSPICPQLSWLILHENPLKSIPELFFKHMTALTVLDLSCTDIVRLPESVSHLENLRALKLDGCECLEFVPSLAKLSKLRVLELPENYECLEAPEGIERLKYLEKLTCCRFGKSNLSLFNRFIGSCLRLRHFNLLCYGDTFQDIYGYNDDGFLETNIVVMAGVKFEAEERVTIRLPSTTQALCIGDFDLVGRRLDSVFRSSGSSIKLKTLVVEECRNVGYLLSGAQQDSSTFDQFGSLENFVLVDMPELEGIVELGGLESELVFPSQFQPRTGGSMFVNLGSLIIKKCPKLKVVFQANLLKQQHPILPNLLSLAISECENLEEIFASPITGTSPIIHLPKLIWFTLKELPRLRSIYRGVVLCDYIAVSKCIDFYPKLEMLPLPDHIWCDASPSTLASIPSITEHREWWEPLYSRYPDDATWLSCLVSHIR